MRMTTVALGLTAAALLVAPGTALAASHGREAPGQAGCKDDGHKYIQGKTATRHGSKTTFVGEYMRFHPCGEDDGHFTDEHKTITLTLTSATTITVFKVENDPSSTKTIAAAHFPGAFQNRSAEPFYKYTGARSAVNTLTEHFVS